MSEWGKNLWSPLGLSLEIAVVAVFVLAATAIPLAHFMARRKFFGKSVVEVLFTVPLVLPPTVVGYLLIVAMNYRHWPWSWIDEHFEYRVIFSFGGAVLAGTVVAFPMLYMPAKAAFGGVAKELEEVAILFGASRLQMFRHVSLPLARKGIASGLILAFARVLGEYGATAMVYGWREDKLTLSIAVYHYNEMGNAEFAWPAVGALMVMSLGMMFFYNRWFGSRAE